MSEGRREEGPTAGGKHEVFGVGVFCFVFSVHLAGGEVEIGEPYYAAHAG